MNLKKTFGFWAAALSVVILPPDRVWVEGDTQGLDNLLEPNIATLFINNVPNALDPSFIYGNGKKKNFAIKVGENKNHWAGIYTDPSDDTSAKLFTTIWGYGDKNVYTWPGKTFIAQSGSPVTVIWMNKLPIGPHLLKNLTGAVDVVDETLHWAYDLPCYTQYTLEEDGTPIVVHLHGGHTDFQYDGNPEFFFSRNWKIQGPQSEALPPADQRKYEYDMSQPAGTLWYHDHALGITRLNVYAGMAGFFIVRDEYDTGLPGNAYDLPVFPYEAAFAIQDRFFKKNGELFYPAFPGDPLYGDFPSPMGDFPAGEPTALAEFFANHMVVNGVIWPKMDVEPRKYRLRLLNGCDSRFLVIEFHIVVAGEKESSNWPIKLPFTVIGNDQGLLFEPKEDLETLVMETGSRYDIIIDFSYVIGRGGRVILANLGGDCPFGGLDEIEFRVDYEFTNRIMAFDVMNVEPPVQDVNPFSGMQPPNPSPETPARFRKVALFEGVDEYGRLQPLLGTAEPATDFNGNEIHWPGPNDCHKAADPEGACDSACNACTLGDKENFCPYCFALFEETKLAGRQMEGTMGWHEPTTENPNLHDVEEWEIWNVSADAHPIHVHLVAFEVISRHNIMFDATADEDGICTGGDPLTGVCLKPQGLVQHNGNIGTGQRIIFPAGGCSGGNCYGAAINLDDAYVDGTMVDVATALPGQVTKIRAKFDKPGRYVWHCHILSHEDHEMMRVLFVGAGGEANSHGNDFCNL